MSRDLRDGESVNAPSLGKFCGTDYRRRVGPTTSNVITIVMETDPAARDRGFDITLKICGAGELCEVTPAATRNRMVVIFVMGKFHIAFFR